jgi:hypothetical protein
LSHAFGHSIAAIAIRAGVVPGLVSVAVKPSRGEERRTDAPAGEERQVLLTGGPRSISKPVALVFGERASTPRFVVKMNRTPEARVGVVREAEMLRYLERERPDLPGVPRLISLEETTDIARAIETPVIGRPLHGDLRRETFYWHTALVTDWVVALAGLQATGALETLSREHIDPIKAEFRGTYDAVIDEREWLQSERLLAGLRDLPVVPEHRDLGPWNIFVADGRLGVVDWESAIPRGLPALDLIYFVMYAAGYAAGVRRDPELVDLYRAVRDPGTSFGMLATAALRRYCAAVGIEPSLLPGLHLLTWMVHARSENLRAVEDAGHGKPLQGADHGLFVSLWRAELAWSRRT